ncbi:MAG: hypothetical protein EOS07_29760 [Mesorhizobium sp.]|nr:MAG: hypothetical protein EOS07_29760 [Mesorhizobium sp.]
MAVKTTLLKVRNWENFQHYRDRNPPWIKLHFALLASEDWVTLDDASKLLAVVCMLVASRNGGMVPNNPAYLKRLAYLDALPNLQPLISCGFLSKVLAVASTAQADARPETETDTEKKDLSGKNPDQPVKSKKKVSYSEAFEEFWKAYPKTPNMSKAEAFAEWKKLDNDECALCLSAIPAYMAFLKTKPDLETIHACRFISKRRFEGFAAGIASAEADEGAQWPKRLAYARSNKTWSSSMWGPGPGHRGCRVPADLLNEGDGNGWREWEQQAA